MDRAEDRLPEYDALEGKEPGERLREELEDPSMDFEELGPEEKERVRGFYGEAVRSGIEEMYPDGEHERLVAEGFFYGMLHANTHEELSGGTVVHDIAKDYRDMAEEFNRNSRNMRKAVDQEVEGEADYRSIAESLLRIQDRMFDKRKEWDRRGLPTPPMDDEVEFMRRTLADPIEMDLHRYLV